MDELSQLGDSAAQGAAERAILTNGGLVRTTRAALEENELAAGTAGPHFMAWMVHHAAQVPNACSVGTTPVRRLTWRRFGTPLAGFGERVWLREPPLEKVNKFNPRCVKARLLGFCLRSSRYIVVDFTGRLRWVWTVKRADFEDRWKIASPNTSLLGWRRGGDACGVHVFQEGGAKSIPPPSAWRARVGTPASDPGHEPIRKRLYFKRNDFRAHGASDHCPGCRTLVSGGRVQRRTEECIIRLEGNLKKTEAGKAPGLQMTQDSKSMTVQTDLATEVQTALMPTTSPTEPAVSSTGKRLSAHCSYSASDT